MAIDTRLREPKEGAVQIFNFDVGALGRRNLLRRMALFAGQAGVLAFQWKPGLRMIEGFRVPLNQRKILAVVVGVAGGAALTRSRLNVVGGVKSLMRRHARCDFRMALQTLEHALAPEGVASRAIRRTVQRLVRAR